MDNGQRPIYLQMTGWEDGRLQAARRERRRDRTARTLREFVMVAPASAQPRGIRLRVGDGGVPMVSVVKVPHMSLISLRQHGV
jgi:hypothetical protein